MGITQARIEVFKIKNGFTTGLSTTVDGSTKSNAIIYPLITPVKRLFYDSGSPDPEHNLSGNLHYHTGHVHGDEGLAYDDLKPAVKMQYVIEAIEMISLPLRHLSEFTLQALMDCIYGLVEKRG